MPPKATDKPVTLAKTPAVLSAESAAAQATLGAAPVTPTPIGKLTKPTATAKTTPMPTPAKPKPIQVKKIPAYTPPVSTEPYTCYTYNWTENWWIAYRYDVTPKPGGTLEIKYQGGSGHGNEPLPGWPMPSTCAHNQPPGTPPPTTSMYDNYPDLSPK